MAEALPSLSNSFKEQFDNQLTCNICLDQYTRPKILACHHSFCLECIQLIPIEIKNGNYYIKCPTCRIEHLTPDGEAANLPNDFKIDTLLDLQKKLVVTKNPFVTCPIHNDPLKVYCETCRQVICRDCAISKEHKSHEWHLISECFDKNRQQIETNLETIKNKMADLNTAVTQTDTTEREVIEKEVQLQEQINTHAQQIIDHAQQIIDQAQRSREQLSQQLHNIVKQKTQLLAAQKQLAQQLHKQPVKIITGLNSPWGIAVCDKGDVVVAEYGLYGGGESCITTLNMEGKKVKSFGTKGQFTCPRGVAITNDGHVLVTDQHRLQKLTTDGVCVKSVGSSGSGSGRLQFNLPTGITVHPITGQIFVADTWNNRIQVFNIDVTFSHTIAPSGNKQFRYPYDVALDNNGYLYIAEFWNSCITKLTTKGKNITRFGSTHLYRPTSLTINNDLVYVTESGHNNRVSIFQTNGTLLHCFGKKGRGKGEFKGPQGITIDALGNLYVSETDNNRITVC